MSNKLLKILLLVSLISTFTPMFAASDPAISLGKIVNVHSTILAEDRELLINLPKGYNRYTNRTYPVFVVLDGRFNFKATASIIHSLAEGGAIPRMIVVGVANTNRWRDLTPVPGLGIPGTGGGDKFLRFLGEELLPWLEKNYRMNGFKVLSGHSLGGLTTLNVLEKAPQLFDAYLALRPTLNWDSGTVLKQQIQTIKTHSSLDKMLYLAIANEQLVRPYYNSLVNMLETDAPDDLKWTSDLFEQYDDHKSVRISGGIAGIRWVFRGWRLTSKQIINLTDEEVVQWHVSATKRYKQVLFWEMEDMTNAAYWGLHNKATKKRAMYLFNLAVKRWPESAYAWSCLGEGLERLGKTREALKQMKKALAMAIEEKNGDLSYYQGMVDRVSKKLLAM